MGRIRHADRTAGAVIGDRTLVHRRVTRTNAAHHEFFRNLLEAAVMHPLTIIASDGRLENGKTGHPRSSGTFARVLGRFVREQKWLTLRQAITKMTLMPAQRLEARVPAMKNKGRIAVGADADLTIFDPERVIDRSTYQRVIFESCGLEE